MKKYVKPELFYERFELSQHIADCDWEWINAEDGSSCYAEPDLELDSPGVMFQLVNICEIDPGDYEGFCYQTGGDGFNTFKS